MVYLVLASAILMVADVPQKTLAGVRLSKPASKLLIQVEDTYKTKVQVEIATDWEPSHYGEATVNEYGVPIIRLNEGSGVTESTIVHELFHLLLRAKEFPEFGFEFQSGDNTESNRILLRWVMHHLRDPLQHWMFYPEMREMGIDPDAELEQEFTEAIERDTYQGTRVATKDYALSLYYYKAQLQIDNNDLLSRIAAWYERKEWKEQMELGELLSSNVKVASPNTPEEEVRVFLQNLNLLLAGTARFELGGWESVRFLGHTQRRVIVKVLPP